MRLRNWLQKPLYVVVSAIVASAGALSVFVGGAAHAVSYNEVGDRSIEMSTSESAATANYVVSFDIGSATGYTLKGMVIDFCSNDPIIGDSCTAPTGFTVGASPSVTDFTINSASQSGWTIASANTGRTLTFTNSTGVSVSTDQTVTFTISGVTNPDFSSCPDVAQTAPNCTFYGRILTYSATTGVTDYTGDSTGQTTTGVVDAGGVAMSTNSQLTITAKVQEQIDFCVYTEGSCSGGGNSITLGDTHGVLSSTQAYANANTQFDLSTNASTGATVRMLGDTLKSGSNSITAIGSTSAQSATNTSQFGLCASETGTTLTVEAPYTGVGSGSSGCSGTTGAYSGSSYFAFDNSTTPESGTMSPYGAKLATATAGTSSTATLVFLGNIPVTQQAGIYTTTLTFVATGEY